MLRIANIKAGEKESIIDEDSVQDICPEILNRDPIQPEQDRLISVGRTLSWSTRITESDQMNSPGGILTLHVRAWTREHVTMPLNGLIAQHAREVES